MGVVGLVALKLCIISSLLSYMDIDESEPFHFVQLLYIIKEKSWDNNTWVVFREDELIKWVNSDRKIYFENTTMFGPEFYCKFQSMIKYFINNYCEKYMRI